jgi:hypothetical protein
MCKSKILAVLCISIYLSGCASPHVVQATKPTDNLLSCNQIEIEMNEAARFRTEAEKEKGVTGTNVAAALLFWPAMIGTYSNANDAIAAANLRSSNLSTLYLHKGCSQGEQALNLKSGLTPAQKLVELKGLFDKGLITKAEYEAKRIKIVNEM